MLETGTPTTPKRHSATERTKSCLSCITTALVCYLWRNAVPCSHVSSHSQLALESTPEPQAKIAPSAALHTASCAANPELRCVPREEVRGECYFGEEANVVRENMRMSCLKFQVGMHLQDTDTKPTRNTSTRDPR